MGAKLKPCLVFVKISQYTFPDSADFHGNILTCPPTQINRNMELYAKAALCLLMPHRSKVDLMVGVDGTPYTLRFREVYERDQLAKSRGEEVFMFTDDNMRFLQNIQSCGQNSMRYKVDKKRTVAWRPEIGDTDDSEEGYNSTQEDEEHDEVTPYETFLEGIDYNLQDNPNDEDPEYMKSMLHNFTFEDIRNKGKGGCGYCRDVKVPIRKSGLLTDGKPFLVTSTTSATFTATQPMTDVPNKKIKYSVNRIVEVLFKKCQSRTSIGMMKDVNVKEANGSVRSVREWPMAVFAKDARQRRAFEAITAAFLLTFYDLPDASNDTETTKQGYSSKYRAAERALRILRGNKDNSQMICLMHGPGGSGKSTVINLVQEYAKSYCNSLGHPYTDKTIVVTAMSGVAATIQHGETTHTTLGLMKKANTKFDDEVKRTWADARLVIVDEISFAHGGDFQKMQRNLHELMQNSFARPYGGLNVIFARALFATGTYWLYSNLQG